MKIILGYSACSIAVDSLRSANFEVVEVDNIVLNDIAVPPIAYNIGCKLHVQSGNVYGPQKKGKRGKIKRW